MRLLWGQSPVLVAFAVASSLLTAVLMLGLLTLMSYYLSGSQRVPATWWQFMALALATTVFQVVGNIFVGYLSQRTIRDLRSGLMRRLIRAPLSSIERHGAPALMTSLERDMYQIGDSLPGIVALSRDMTFMVVCFGYLGWLAYKPLLAIIAVIGLGAALHHALQSRGLRHINALRSREQQLAAVLKNLVDGIKQLKLSQMRRVAIVGSIQGHQESISKLDSSSQLSFAVANAYAVFLFLTLLVIVIFGGLQGMADRQVLMAYTLTLFFLLGPLQTITNVSQQLGRAGVSLERIRKLEKDFQDATTESEDSAARLTSPARSWNSLALRAISHSFKAEERQEFTFGPLDLTLRRGEVLFVVGGNGSGKTTFGKLVTGLYPPQAGSISLDHATIDDTNRDWYRQQFGGVFSDFCLFEGLAGTEHDQRVEAETKLLQHLKLDHVVDQTRGLFAQAASFSSGERRRVAMLLACVDDKPAYLFDEFAADQDPQCRDMFYYEIIPRLREQGKLIIVITHDSRYFECADLILTLERGMEPTLRRSTSPLTLVQ